VRARALLISAATAALLILLSADVQRDFENASYRKIYVIAIQNTRGGRIDVQFPDNRTLTIGHVLSPATTVNADAFHASLWGESGSVVASAVNAVHIKVASNTDRERGSVLSLYPKELYSRDLVTAEPVTSRKPFIIYTDIPGGRGIFGGAFPIMTQSPVTYARAGVVSPIGIFYLPKLDDRIFISATVPESVPRSITFENRVGGSVYAEFDDGSRVDIATVTRSVKGVGKFEGGQFCAPGGVRATHSGVIDFKTGDYGRTGGFQVVPFLHSYSRELFFSRAKPQFLIVEALSPNVKLVGEPPLFARYIWPSSGLEAPVAGLPKLRLTVRWRGKSSFKTPPALNGRIDAAILAASAFRIEYR
jgi:hypothetical protein